VRATVVSVSETSAQQSISTGPEAKAQPVKTGVHLSVAYTDLPAPSAPGTSPETLQLVITGAETSQHSKPMLALTTVQSVIAGAESLSKYIPTATSLMRQFDTAGAFAPPAQEVKLMP